MERMTATLPKNRVWNGRNLSRDKELVKAYTSIARDDKGEVIEAITVRYWMGRSRSASRVYCTIWLEDGPGGAGHGMAGGYGYDRNSAALSAAIDSAGIKLSASIAGVGYPAECAALESITRAMGYEPLLIVSHG